MHVVMFTDYPVGSLGGSQTSLTSQRAALEKLGHLVTIVALPMRKGEPFDPNVIIVPSHRYSPYESFVLPSARREKLIMEELSKRPPIDIIHLQSNIGVAIMGIHIAKRLQVPLVQTMHTRDDVYIHKAVKFPWLITGPTYYMHKALLKAPPSAFVRLDRSWSVHNSWRIMVHHCEQADAVTVPSRHFAEQLKAHGLTRPIDLISNGLDDDMLRTVWAKKPSERPARPVRLIWVGRISIEKRPLLFLEAIKDIPDITVDMYGEGPDIAKVTRYIQKYGLEKSVHLRGRVSQTEIIQAIAEHDIFVQSSYRFDNQPMVILESIAAGTPIVLSDPDLAAGIPEGACLVAKSSTADSLREAITSLVADPNKLASMKAVMRDHRSLVAQSRMTKQILTVYMRIIEQNGSP